MQDDGEEGEDCSVVKFLGWWGEREERSMGGTEGIVGGEVGVGREMV